MTAAAFSRSRLLAAGVLLSSVLSLQGCVPVAVTGVAVAAHALSDRRTVGAQTEDAEIQVRALNRIATSVKEASGIGVSSYNRRVLLTGQVPDAQTRRAVEEAVIPTPGIRQIHNELLVAPRATLAAETRDFALTARVKASFVEQKDMSANLVKVVTESGVVYLMGLVTEREGAAYAGVASRVSGVTRVVTLFEYISEDAARKAAGTTGS